MLAALGLTSSDPVKEVNGKAWLAMMILKLSEIKRDDQGRIDTATYLNAMDDVSQIYSVLFSTQFIVDQLRSDINGSCETVRRCMNEMPDGAGKTLQGIVQHGMKTVPREELVSDPKSSVRGTLWLNRACAFIVALLRGLEQGGTSSDAATAAYEAELKPYHGFIAGTVVGKVMQYVPTAEEIMEKFGLQTKEEAKAQLEQLLVLWEPLVLEIKASSMPH